MASNMVSASTSSADLPLEYRALSSGAVVSLVLGCLSIITIPSALTSVSAYLMVCPLPLAGLLVGVRSLRQIGRLRGELAGQSLATAGTVLSVFFFVGGFLLAGYVYATEVPSGYQRLGFMQLRPTETDRLRHQAVPPDVMQLDGRQVFFKGYIRPSAQRFGLDQFLLVRDNNQCCFGKNIPAYFDRIQVQLESPLRANYSTRLFRVAGTLRIEPQNARLDVDLPVFSLQADYLK